MPDQRSKPTVSGLSVVALFKEYGAKLEGFLARRSRRPQEARDLAQEVYLRLLRFPPEQVIERPHAYLYRIASNVVHDSNLRAKTAPVTFDSEIADEFATHAADVWGGDPGDQLIREEELRGVLMQLPRAQLIALLLHKRDGMTVAEIARQLNTPVDTIKSRIAYALAHCRAATRKPSKR